MQNMPDSILLFHETVVSCITPVESPFHAEACLSSIIAIIEIIRLIMISNKTIVLKHLTLYISHNIIYTRASKYKFC